MRERTEHTIEVSGVARGNPGLAGVGIITREPRGRVVARVGRYLGLATPSQASYEAVIAGLEEAGQYEPSGVAIYTSDETVRRQVLGLQAIHAPDLIDRYIRATELLGVLGDIEIRTISPDQNELAESVANVAIDSRGRRTAFD